jgi:hypothetical protein
MNMFFLELLSGIFWVVVLGGAFAYVSKIMEWREGRFLDNKIGGWMSKLDMMTIQIFPPIENTRSLSEMENFFVNIATIFSGKSKKDIYLDGKYYENYTFEIHSRGGQIGFFVHLNRNYLATLRSSLTAHYPGTGIIECPDPFQNWPKEWTGQMGQFKDMYGTDISMAASDLFPLKSWKDFQKGTEAPITDPITVLISSLEDIDPGDYIILQFVLRPYSAYLPGEKAGKRWQEELKKLKSDFANNSQVETNEAGQVQMLTQLERDIINAAENKMTIDNYLGKIRVLILSDKPAPVRLLGRVMNYFKQFTGKKQFLKPNGDTKSNASAEGDEFEAWGFGGPEFAGWLDKIYWKREQEWRKRKMYKATVGRSLSKGSKPQFYDVESLAAIYHFPLTTFGVDKSLLTRVTTDYGSGNAIVVGQPPSNLPM